MKRLLVITGATGGIGGHMARKALEQGYDVLGIARRRPAEDPGFPVHLLDVGDHAQVAEFFSSLRREPLWGLVNAAGTASMNLLLTTPPERMAAIVSTNLLGTMHCCAEAAKLMARRQGGRIVNFSTIAVPLALAGESVYAASKAGVESFSRCFAKEVGGFQITVNVIAPGPVSTPLLAGLSPEQIQGVLDRQNVRRMATPEDIWKAAVFFLDEANGMISGETLRIGGV